MKKVLTIILSLCLVLASFGLALAAEEDQKGSKDHPLLTRMPGFKITDYKDLDYESYNYIVGKGKKAKVEGHFYYVHYKLKKGLAEPGELKIRRNIQNALKEIGGEVVYDEDFNRVSTMVLRKGGRETWVEVRSYNQAYKLTIVERESMEQAVVANAEALGNDINATGHVPVYGIFFDTGKAEVRPESEPALVEIAKLLKHNGGLSIYVVGHTDNVGGFDANMKLSRERAEAVARALISRHGIAPARLKPYGVASLSPVTSNETEDGKAKNRRVELVKQ